MTETASLTVPPKLNGLGYSVCATYDGDEVLGGAPGWEDGVGQGAVDLFLRPVSGWKTSSKPKTRLTALDGMPGESFGFSAFCSSSSIVVGAPYTSVGTNPEEGAAYVFGR
jgi:hypothetical protein